MANATISQLIAAVKAVLPKIASNQARALIKAENARSVSKAEEVAAQYKGQTKEQLAEAFGEAEAETEAPKGRTIKAKGQRARRTATVVTAGPRGFRFGEVWNASVKAGEGVALAPANINKLYAHADSLGIAYDKRSDDAAKIAKAIGRKL